MSNYFLFSWKNMNTVASAFAPKDSKQTNELIKELAGASVMPFEFQLIKLSAGKEGLIESPDLSGLDEVWLDYQPNSIAWPLMSEKLKTVIERNLIGEEGIDWISAEVNGLGDKKTYFIPRFNKELDVLDKETTLYTKNLDYVIRPSFALSKIKDFSMFTVSSPNNDIWKITSGFYINEALKKAIQKEKLSGINFEKTRVV